MIPHRGLLYVDTSEEFNLLMDHYCRVCCPGMLPMSGCCYVYGHTFLCLPTCGRVIYKPHPLLISGVTVYFDSSSYDVREGEDVQVSIATDGEFATPFNVTVQLQNGSATGKPSPEHCTGGICTHTVLGDLYTHCTRGSVHTLY